MTRIGERASPGAQTRWFACSRERHGEHIS